MMFRATAREPGQRGRRVFAHLAISMLALGACVSCMHAVRTEDTPPGAAPPAVDSLTAALWRMDESAGTRVADAGRWRLDGTAGIDTRTDFGRFRNARVLSRSINSFVYVPYSPLLESRTMTIEAWIQPVSFGDYEDTPIAARWTEQANMQSWLFTIVGLRKRPPLVRLPGPGYHLELARLGAVGHLMFAFQPQDAGVAEVLFSSIAIELNRWTHVAVSHDGAVVRFYIDGRMDSQYAVRSGIRASEAPLLAGNYFDPRGLSDFSGDLRVGSLVDSNPYYAFDGEIDELRLSSAARKSFWEVGEP